ncbi:protoglobin domain-containing protein [Oceanithermus sp.]|uniref:protoglobin domain-containing protein n=1 Tax=Oceanithermus sp. TaxID=2268145 RepID=UPI00257AD9D2|nr:protoglobin domain-containing protein [Oceanithermus sp.]
MATPPKTEQPVWTQVLDLPPPPEAQMREQLAFVGLNETAKRQMYLDGEPLLAHAADWVAAAYDHLSRFAPTAKALGWEGRIPEDELYLRRTFFSGWIGRTIGVDTSDEFARYLFHAGRVHAGYGPDRRFVPPEWVSLSLTLILRMFSTVVPAERLGLWTSYLGVQQEVMRAGFEAALELEKGRTAVKVDALGLALPALPEPLEVRIPQGGTVLDAVLKVLTFRPELRDIALEPVQDTEEHAGWMEEVTRWRFKPRWALLKNGRDVAYLEGLATRLKTGDHLTFLPPGR